MGDTPRELVASLPGNPRPITSPRGESARGVFAERVAIAVLIVILIGGTTYLLWQSINTVLLAFAGTLFGLFLSALGEWVRNRTGLRYGWALALVVLLLLLIFAGMGWFIANSLMSQFAALSQELPRSFDQLRKYLAQQPWGKQLLEQSPLGAKPSSMQVGEMWTRATGLVSGVASFVAGAIVILFVGLFVAIEPGLYKSGILYLTPPTHHRRAAQTLDAIGYNLRWWLVGQSILMITIGVTTALGLWLIGLPMPLALGLIAGFLEMVPYLGPWLSAVPAALIALLIDPLHLWMVLGLYLGLHLLEGYVLVPLIQRRAVRLPPALTVIAQFLFAEMFGFMGILVAAPLTVVAIVSLKMLYVKDALGDRTIEVPGEPDTASHSGPIATKAK